MLIAMSFVLDAKMSWNPPPMQFLIARFSQMVWKMSRFWKVIESRKAMPFADLLRVMPSVVPMEDFALICWLAWKLWGERNKVVHGGEA